MAQYHEHLVVPPGNGLVREHFAAMMRINKHQLPGGTLYLTEEAFSWQPAGCPSGITVPWTDVTLHATALVPEKCVYVMLDCELEWPGVLDPAPIHPNGNGHAFVNGNGLVNGEHPDDYGSDHEDIDLSITELWFVPADINDVVKIYSVMTQCQLLMPDEPQDDYMPDNAAFNIESFLAEAGNMQSLNLNETEQEEGEEEVEEEDADRFADAD